MKSQEYRVTFSCGCILITPALVKLNDPRPSVCSFHGEVTAVSREVLTYTRV